MKALQKIDTEYYYKSLLSNIGMPFDKIKNNCNLFKVKFCDILNVVKLYNNYFDNSKGGYSFKNKSIINELRKVMTQEQILLESVKYFHITSKYKFSYIYLIKGTHNGSSKYKIGKADNPIDRIKMFNVKIPFDIETIFTFCIKDSLSFEKHLHNHFSDKRLVGEWFDLDDNDILELMSLSVVKELEDYYDCVEEERKAIKQKQWKSKDDYIEYLESLLVLNNIVFDGI